MIDLRGIAEERFLDASHAENTLKGREANLEIPLPEAFRQSEIRGTRGVVILGDPGSGKTRRTCLHVRKWRNGSWEACARIPTVASW